MARPKKKHPPKPKDLLMWVGVCHYPTIESFVEEATRMGVSKRVSHPPLGVKLGDSLLFLAHDEGKRVECAACNGLGVEGGEAEIRLIERREKKWVAVDPDPKSEEALAVTLRVKNGEGFARLDREMRKTSKGTQKYEKVPGQPKCERCKGWGKFPDGKVFGFCRVNAVELILDTAEAVREYQEREQELQKEGKVEVTPMVGGEGVEGPRGCGFRQVGGLYLVSGPEETLGDLQSLAAGLGANFMLKGTFVELKNPVSYPHHRFFGTKLVNREEILGAE